MTVFRIQPRTCERAREWASLALDGELSELEQALLDAHVARCASCGVYIRDVSGATASVRGAELVRLSRPITLPLRRRFGVAARALQAGTATAAVIACAVGLGTLFGSLGGGGGGAVSRLARNSISSGPSTESDALIKAPRLAMLRAELGVGKQRGVRVDV